MLRMGAVLSGLVLLGGISLVLMWKPWAPSATAGRDEFAADRVDVNAGPFDTKRALGYLADICKIGPRVSGSDGMKTQQDLLQKHFEAHGGKVAWQRFSARQRSQRQPVEMANLIVSWHPDRERRVILCSHYDTRPIADQEPNPRDWGKPFLSANDGGSGVAWLMELAHHMKELPTQVGVDFVIFDGEEYVFDPRPNGDDYFFGSEHFAQTYRKERPKYRYISAVLLDMIAGKNPRFPIESNSLIRAGGLVEQLWGLAAELRCPAFQNQMGFEVRDDHLALNDVGIPAVDIIDFSYPHWHRLTDVPENCSGEGMAQVARVLMAWLQRVK